MSKILLIEDNREIAGIIFDFFEEKSLELDYADNGELGIKLAKNNHFDVIILDLMLPRIDGLTVCKNLREAGNYTPILMLTSLDNKNDMLNGFHHGADDYLTKPFDLDILHARINALIKRSQGKIANKVISFGALKIDQKNRIAYRNKIKLDLNPSTYTILELLCRNAPDTVSKTEIAQQLWGTNESNFDALRSHIYHLRNQLDKPFSTAMLTTVPKIGFKLENNDSP